MDGTVLLCSIALGVLCILIMIQLIVDYLDYKKK